MEKLIIQEPIWKTRRIGINKKYLAEKSILIDIVYKNKEGVRLYPATYTITAEKIKTYTVQVIRGNILFLVPIDDLEVYYIREL